MHTHCLHYKLFYRRVKILRHLCPNRGIGRRYNEMDLCKQFPGQPLQRPMLALHRSDSDHHNFYPTLEELQD